MRGLPLLIFILLIAGGVIYFASRDSAPSNLGAIVTSFDSCVAAGNPIMESYPRRCAHNGATYVEDISEDTGNTETPASILCKEEDRGALCPRQTEPVCGLTRVECITTPCDPVKQSYGNACAACNNDRVISYTDGLCDAL
jgi:hypothetical protein